jgi:hypothetical protein
VSIDPSKFEAQGLPTKEQVRTVWDAHPEASARKVAIKLTGMGYEIGYRTVARWKKKNWVEKEKPALEDTGKPNVRAVNKALKAELAKAKKPEPAPEPAAPAAAPEVATGAEGISAAVVGGEMTDQDVARIEAVRTELKPKTVEDLRAELEKERLIYNIILLREAGRKANIQVLIPKETSEFVGAFTKDKAANSPPAPIAPSAPGLNGSGNGHLPLIEGDFTVVSPTSSAIRKFLAKENAA